MRARGITGHLAKAGMKVGGGCGKATITWQLQLAYPMQIFWIPLWMTRTLPVVTRQATVRQAHMGALPNVGFMQRLIEASPRLAASPPTHRACHVPRASCRFKVYTRHESRVTCKWHACNA